MLPYEPKLIGNDERPWRFPAAVVLGSVSLAAALWLWWQTTPGLWQLATFMPPRPVHPRGFMTGLALFMFGGFLNAGILAAPAAAVSKRSGAQAVATLAVAASLLPTLNLVLFFVIKAVRHI